MRRQSDREEQCVTSTQAARQLGVSLRTVQLWVENGTLRAWKTAGGHRRIPQSSIEEVLRQRESQLNNRRRRGPATVLLVDDDHYQLDFLKAQIEDWHLPLRVDTASNGYEALIQSGRLDPDLAILDLMMPGLDGFQLIRTLTQSGVLNADQVIALTALDAPEIARRGGLPADVAVLQKPFAPEQLRHMVQEMTDHLH
ncbi:MAG TPA: response regulator [Gammaproteobacteria bacterium]|nr:response regulator [Gammaproteobacteria bacterium]